MRTIKISLNTVSTTYRKNDTRMKEEKINKILGVSTFEELKKIKEEMFLTDLNIFPQSMRDRVDLIRMIKSKKEISVEAKRQGCFIIFEYKI